MPEPYRKQQDVIPNEEVLKESQLKYINANILPEFEKLAGVSISGLGEKVPMVGGVPQIFLLDEKDPANPRSLEDEHVEVGSRQFWELMQKGRVFAYPAGKKEPVQLQLKGRIAGSPFFSVSEPLSTQPDKLASRDFNYRAAYNEAPPEPKQLPPELPRPGFFARFAHSLNSNWFKAEHEAYRKNRQERREIDEQNRKQKEEYEQKAAKTTKALHDACLAVSKGAEAAFGAKRTEEILAAERDVFQNRQMEREKAETQDRLDKSRRDAEEAAIRTEDRIGNMISIYGPNPKPLQKLHRLGMYNKGKKQADLEKNPESDSFRFLKPIVLPQMKIGDKTVDDRLFANLALHAQLTPENGRALKEKKGSVGIRQTYMDEGLTEKETDEMLKAEAGGMLVADFVSHHIRVDLDQHFEKRTQPGREQAEKALLEYRKGNKEPLAEIITNAAKYMYTCAVDEQAGGRTTLTISKLTGELLDLLDEDPDLEDAARKNGLTDKMVESCRGIDALQELEHKSLKAEAKLQKAAAEHKELTKEEKTQCLKDIFKYRTADAMFKDQAADRNGKNYLTVKTRLEKRKEATQEASRSGRPMPEGIKPMNDVLLADLTAFHYRPKLFVVPPILATLANNREKEKEAELLEEERKPDSMDKVAESTVNGLRLDKKDVPLNELDTKTLAERFALGKGPSGVALLAEQGRLLVAEEQEKKQNEIADRELNNAVVYDPEERHI